MTKIIFVVTLAIIALTTFGQRKKNEPISVLIIKPREVKFDSKHQKYIDRRGSEIEYEINNPIRSIEYAPGEKESRIERASTPIKIKVNYFTYASLVAFDHLESVCMGLDKPCPIIIKELDSDSKNLDLQQLAEKHIKQYVLDFTRIEILERDQKFQARISVRFYNKINKSFLIDTIFTGEEKEDLNFNLEGLPLECNNPMDCAYFNALSKIISKVICSLNCGWIAEVVSLDKRRKEELIKNYFNKEFDRNVLKPIIPSSDSNINIDISFQALFNADSTKFVSFFLEKVTDSATLKRTHLGMDDPQYRLITHSYVVYGVKYNNKWFYTIRSYGFGSSADQTLEGRRKDLFNELQSYQYGFFKEGTIEPDPQFWNTKLFAVVGESTDQYKSYSYKIDEFNYQPYKGLYLIVAKQLREIKRLKDEEITKELIKRYIEPLVEKLKLNPQNEGRPRIFPTEMNVILAPVVENQPNDQVSTRYFVLLADEKGDYKVYEWIYYNPERLRKYSWGGYYDEDLKKLANWENGYDYLNDQNFWSKYVLAKKNGEFIYLKEIK